MNTPGFRIKENSSLARLASKKLGVDNVAIVFGNTIHLYGRSKAAFLADSRWVKHELCHVKQFKEHGFFPFIAKYLWESIRKGYYNNKYEAEARAAEEEHL